MSFFRNLSLASKFCVLIVVMLAGFGTLGCLAYNTIENVRINGDVYSKVIQGKDLIADILPPPLYIVEPDLVAHRIVDEDDEGRLAKLIDRSKTLQNEYQTRLDYWRKNLPSGELTDLLRKAETESNAYLDQFSGPFLGLVSKGDRAEARKLLHGPMRDAFKRHQKLIYDLVASTEKQNTKTEDDAIRFASTRVTTLIVIGFAVSAIVTTLCVCLALNLRHSLGETVRVMEAMTKGDLTQRLVVNSTDELGRMGAAVNRAIEATRGKVEIAAVISALDKSLASIEFTPEGTIRTANDNFLKAIGYPLDEIKGRHHSIFVDEATRNSAEYAQFWTRLHKGESQAGEFRRVCKNGAVIWLQSSYTPILDASGKPFKIVNYANDVTTQVQLREEVRERVEQEKRQADELRQRVAMIVSAADLLSQGDFSHELPNLGDDSIGQMSKALNTAVQSVRGTLAEVRNVAATVAAAAQELSAASEEIASGAQEQASSLEETAASLEEITATIKQNTDSAQQARQLAGGSRDVAEKGGQVVGDAVEAMAAINQSSKKIADIITAIDEIAFQTNLLALNAAVEAARAGEQGRGFAVVASEVRNLAQRSATAAKEIKSLIQDSVRKVDNGTELVNRSGQTLSEIVTSVKRVTDIVTEIAAASREQSTGVDQVNKAVAQMDKVTQTNAGQTEELSGTSQTLLGHAEHLQSLVSRFRLGENEAVAASTPAKVQPRTMTKATRYRSTPPRMGSYRELVRNGPKKGEVHDLDRLDDEGNGDGFEEF